MKHLAFGAALAATLLLTVPAGAHDDSAGECKIEEWRFLGTERIAVGVEGFMTCVTGEITIRFYEGDGENRRFLGMARGYIRDHAFDAHFNGVVRVNNRNAVTMRYSIRR